MPFDTLMDTSKIHWPEVSGKQPCFWKRKGLNCVLDHFCFQQYHELYYTLRAMSQQSNSCLPGNILLLDLSIPPPPPPPPGFPPFAMECALSELRPKLSFEIAPGCVITCNPGQYCSLLSPCKVTWCLILYRSWSLSHPSSRAVWMPRK